MRPKSGDTLPVAAEQPKIVDKLKTHDKIGLQSPTGGGKTMKQPVIVLEHFKWRAAACLVEVSIFAAREVVNGLCKHEHWDRSWIQLRTSQDNADQWNHLTA